MKRVCREKSKQNSTFIQYAALLWLLSQFPGKGKNQNKHGGQSILTVGDRKLSVLTRSTVWVARKLERGTTISYFLWFGIRFLKELNHDSSKAQWQVKQQKIPSFDLIFFLLVSRFKNNRQLHFRHGTYVEIWFKSVWSATYFSLLMSLEWRNVTPQKGSMNGIWTGGGKGEISWITNWHQLLLNGPHFVVYFFARFSKKKPTQR